MGKGTCPGRARDGRVQADGIGARRTGPREAGGAGVLEPLPRGAQAPVKEDQGRR